MTWEKEVKEINHKRHLAEEMGGKDSVALQHSKGRLTIRERIHGILDENSFDEVGKVAGHSDYDENGKLQGFTPANFVLGFGKINDRSVVIGG